MFSAEMYASDLAWFIGWVFMLIVNFILVYIGFKKYK